MQQTLPRELKSDALTGKLRVLYMGDAGGRSPFPYMVMEPGMSATPVAYLGRDQLKRKTRVYMPRTAKRLRTEYDVMILSDAMREMFTSNILSWMSDGVLEGAMGLIMIGGAHSFEGRGTTNPSWSMTTVAEVLPVEILDYTYSGSSMKMIIVDHEAELAKALPFQTLGRKGIFTEGHKVGLRQTSHLIAEAETATYGRLPHLIWADVGTGRGFAMTTDWTPDGGTIFMTWKYYADFALDVVMFAAGKPLPMDVDTVYMIRRRIREYRDTRLTLNTLIDIVDNFGGNINEVLEGARECDEAKAEADSLYFVGEYLPALEGYEAALSKINEKIEEARVIARQALFYVYVIEWATVTGTFLISGVIVYTLMVRRRMYAEVSTTRLYATRE